MLYLFQCCGKREEDNARRDLSRCSFWCSRRQRQGGEKNLHSCPKVTSCWLAGLSSSLTAPRQLKLPHPPPRTLPRRVVAESSERAAGRLQRACSEAGRILLALDTAVSVPRLAKQPTA
eukprot:3928528-Pleurochrysis_carterae.AAC.1